MSAMEDVYVVSAIETDTDWPPLGAEQFMMWLSTKLDEIPSEFRASACVRVSSFVSRGEAFGTIDIWYSRTKPEPKHADMQPSFCNKDKVG